MKMLTPSKARALKMKGYHTMMCASRPGPHYFTERDAKETARDLRNRGFNAQVIEVDYKTHNGNQFIVMSKHKEAQRRGRKGRR